MIVIDKLCYQSNLRYVNAGEKFAFSVLTLLVCVISRSIVIAAIVLAVTGDITEPRVFLQSRLQFAGPLVERIRTHALQDELIPAFALSAAELQVLHRPHEHLDPCQPAHFFA